MAMSEKRREYNRKWNRENKEKVRAYRERTKDKRNARRRELYRADEGRRTAAVKAARTYRSTHPHKRCDTDLKRQYGISLVEYNRILAQQDGGCAICGNPPGKRILHVDHHHSTGQVRGLLCDNCNMGLGKFQDNPDLLERASAYVRGFAYE